MIVAALAFSSAAFAQTKAPEPDYTLAFNVGAVTDYRFRGISQSRLRPALQGGIDFTHKSGFYLGFWGSTIKILEDIPGGDGPVELDFYGGYRGTAGPVGYDVGLLRYQYPSENFTPTVNTTELYGALTFGPATVKYSHSLDKQTFGVPNSRGSYYLEAAATFDLGSGYSVTPHIGHQKFDNNPVPSYTDYSLAVNKDFGNGFVGSVTLVTTDADKPFYSSPANGKFLGKTGLVLGVKYNF
jgi:uncharacterized protein (TIGR02001 family)